VIARPTRRSRGGSSTSYAYDVADRAKNTGYTYDNLGRTLTLPAAATPTGVATTLGYYVDDSAYTITTGTATQSFGLDPAGRRLADTWATSGTTTRTITRHYTDASDNPGWSDDVQGTTTTLTRYAETLGGGLGAYTASTNGGTPTTTLTFANLHGDVNATVTLPATGTALGIDAWNDYNEYGAPLTGSATGSSKLAYGWLGTHQRSTDDPSGLTLMGARVYSSTTGRFTSVDAVTGGNENGYIYPNDPINTFDTSGNTCLCKSLIGVVTKFVGKAPTAGDLKKKLGSGVTSLVLAALAFALACDSDIQWCTDPGISKPGKSDDMRKYRIYEVDFYEVVTDDFIDVWKWDITQQTGKNKNSRINKAKRDCRNSQYMTGGMYCGGQDIIVNIPGYTAARLGEYLLIAMYYMQNGRFPVGQPSGK
jgi:RHS repeat-associated protein